MRSLPSIAWLVLLLVVAPGVTADITDENAADYLITGELTLEILVRPDNIDWIEDLGVVRGRSETLTSELASNPGNLDAALELITLFGQQNRESDAKELAMRVLPAFQEQFGIKSDETSAVRLAEVVRAAGDEKEYDPAYRALLPFLESGRAKRETCITAIKNRMAQQDYGLAKRIADLYLRVYPEFAELYYQRYATSLTENLRNSIFKTIQSSSEQFLRQRNDISIDIDNVQEFVHQYLEELESRIDSASLLRAIKLEPGNYRYNLSAAVYRAMTHFFSKSFIQLLAEDVEVEGIEKLLLQANPDLFAILRGYLKRAEDNRPKRDIQVFLGYAFVSLVFGRFAEIESYARMAIDIRPDLPEGYDALLLSVFLPSIASEGYTTPEVNNRAIEIYKDKVRNTGEDASDYSVLAGLYFSIYREVDAGSKSAMLEKMKYYLDRTLEIDSQHPLGLISLANYHIATKAYAKAIGILEKLKDTGEDPQMRGSACNNLGVARILNGDRERGIDDLREAGNLLDDNKKTLDALNELGVY